MTYKGDQGMTDKGGRGMTMTIFKQLYEPKDSVDLLLKREKLSEVKQ